MSPGYFTFPDFFVEAPAMRAALDAHFADPMQHRPETHQVWNYWSVPGQYTYLRTQPEKIFTRPLFDRFFLRLRQVATERFGLTGIGWPYLSLYVAGCGQGLHNDAKNGRLGFVYSLTNWEGRRFDGGETMIFREQRYFGSNAMTEAAAATSFYDLVPSSFNQLLVFDDRLPHAVPRLEGTMIPQDGRAVVHGHLAEGPVATAGALTAVLAQTVVSAQLPGLRERLKPLSAGLAGLLTLRLEVAANGRVAAAKILLDRLLRVAETGASPEEAVALVLRVVGGWTFPPAGGPSGVTFAIPFDTLNQA